MTRLGRDKCSCVVFTSSGLQVDLPKDPALEDFKHVKPAFGISPPVSETGSPHSPSGVPHACPMRAC